MSNHGRFITFEGGEGVGKTTQARMLGRSLEAAGKRVALTREPGGSDGAEAIRGLLVRGDAERWDSLTETLLLYAARRDHLRRTIRPALARGEWVLCDRFNDSTRAYQGAGRGAGLSMLDALYDWVVEDTAPDLTLILDAPLETGLGRARGRSMGEGEDRFEGMAVAFHRRLREGFRAIAAAEPDRCALIDATQTPQTVLNAVCATVAARLPESGLRPPVRS